MNRKKIAGLLPDYLLSIPAAMALAGNLCEFFVVPKARADDINTLLLFSAALLLLFHVAFFSRFTTKVSLGAAAASACIYAVVMYFAFHLVPVPSYDDLVQYLFEIVAFCTCLVVYFGSRNLWTVFSLLVGGSGLFFYMSYSKMNPKAELYYVFLASLVALFIKKVICEKLTIQSAKEFFQIYGHSLCTALAILLIAQFLYTQADIRIFRKNTPSSSGSAVSAKPSVVTGYADLDNMNNFGAPLELNNDLMLTVHSTADSFYLKGDTYDNYNNSRWTKMPEQTRLRRNDFRSYFWLTAYTYSQDKQFFSEHSLTDFSTFINHFGEDQAAVPFRQVTVIHRTGNMKTLFLPTGFFRFQTRNSLLEPSTDDYSRNNSVPTGASYTMTASMLNLKAPAIQYLLKNDRSVMQSILSDWRGQRENQGRVFSAKPEDSTFTMGTKSYSQTADAFEKYDATVSKQYLTLGSSVTKRTKELAASLTKGCSNDYEKVEAIRQYLQQYYNYTLNPPQPPKGQDLVDYFLFQSRLGYCVHYATAMVVLLRSVGVPARFVCGFVSPPKLGGTFNVTNKQAHAWVEVYSHTLGFYTVDPTGTSSQTVYQPNANSKPEVTPAGKNGKTPNRMQNSGFPLMGVAIGVLLFCALSALIAVHKKLRFRRLDKLDAGSRVIGYYRYYLAVLSRFGYRRVPHETYSEFAERLEIEPEFCKQFRGITVLYLRAAYSNVPPDIGDVKRMTEFRRVILKAMRGYAGPVKYAVNFPWL